MDTKAIHFSADAGLQAIFAHNILIHRGGIERAVEVAGAVVGDGTEHGAGGIGSVAGERQVFLDQPLREHLDGYEPDLSALALDPKMQHALPALHVLNAQPAELLAADAVIEQGGEDGAIAHALEGIVGRRIEQLTSLRITEGRRAAFVVVGHWPLDAVDRIAGDGVALAPWLYPGFCNKTDQLWRRRTGRTLPTRRCLTCLVIPIRINSKTNVKILNTSSRIMNFPKPCPSPFRNSYTSNNVLSIAKPVRNIIVVFKLSSRLFFSCSSSAFWTSRSISLLDNMTSCTFW